MGSPFCFSLTILHAVPRVFSVMLSLAHFPRQHHFLDDLTARNGSFKISLSFLPAFFPSFLSLKKKMASFFWVKNTFALLITVIYVNYYYFIIIILLLLL